MRANAANVIQIEPPEEDPTPRRHRGTGTIDGPSAEGHYRFRCPDGAGGRIISNWEFDSYDDAEGALIALRHKLTSRRVVPAQGMTFGEYFDNSFIVHAAKNRAPGTVQMYKNYFSRVRKSGLADRRLRDLTRRDLRQWARKQDVQHPGHFLAIVHAILQQAVEDELLPSNPAANIRLDVKKTDPGDRCPTPEEQEMLLACKAISVPDMHAIMFALGAGLRPGEWRNLEIADVHLDDPQPYVLVQYGTNDRGPTKNRKKRRVPLFGMGLRALESWLPQIPTYHLKNDLGLVFPDPRGRRRADSVPFGRIGPRDDCKPKFLWYLEQAGIARRLTPHSLRHGCATDLLTGVRGPRLEIWQVQILLGHERITTTLKYVHQGERDLFKVLANQAPIRTAENPPLNENAEKQAVSGETGGSEQRHESCLPDQRKGRDSEGFPEGSRPSLFSGRSSDDDQGDETSRPSPIAMTTDGDGMTIESCVGMSAMHSTPRPADRPDLFEDRRLRLVNYGFTAQTLDFGVRAGLGKERILESV